tara:strand:- start:70 stop:903 length:834 start_codon:yes stop_codon:yes gene_type:complete
MSLFQEQVKFLKKKLKFAARENSSHTTLINIKGYNISSEKHSDNFTVMAGPCAIESQEQILTIAKYLSSKNVPILRGGAFKPRTSPYSFQGLGIKGLEYMQEAASTYGMLSVSEVMDSMDVEVVSNYVDILQIGARNMQNYSLLKTVGKTNKPILLKRHFAATYEEFLLAAEYILSHGNPNVILCERGIRTFESLTRNTLDLAAVPILQQVTHLPIITDPSHGTGIKEIIPAMTVASKAIGANGVIIEVHSDPENSLSDKEQALSFQEFDYIIKSIL